MSPISDGHEKYINDISNDSEDRNFSDEGQDGRDSKMYNSLITPEKTPAKIQISEEEAKK